MAIGALIVDDQRDVRMLMRVVIEEANEELFVACEAASGDEAIERIDACDPTVVLLDYMMPEVDGLETAERIRERRPGQPIIMYSAFVDDRLLERAREMGISACLSKGDFMHIPDAMRAVASGAAG